MLIVPSLVSIDTTWLLKPRKSRNNFKVGWHYSPNRQHLSNAPERLKKFCSFFKNNGPKVISSHIQYTNLELKLWEIYYQLNYFYFFIKIFKIESVLAKIEFHSSAGVLFGVKKYCDALQSNFNLKQTFTMRSTLRFS